MKPKITIVIKHGQIVAMYSDQEVFLQMEVHDLDQFPNLTEECKHEVRNDLHFTERMSRS